jgi:CRISPR-associated protein Cst2
MSLHVFGAILTTYGTAANNRGVTEGNTTTLQKLIWNGQVHTTVSAETIRFALRRRLATVEPCNRTYHDDERLNGWKDPQFKAWGEKASGEPFIDDDLLGFMSAEAAKQEGEKGGARVRRAVLELTRSVSLIPWTGDVTFNAASPGATPSAQKKGSNPVPYSTEMHATRYQYGFALTPERLAAKKAARACAAIRGLCELAEVAGNQGRFLYDFSPESVIFRATEDPAPRILYAFEARGDAVTVRDLLRKVSAGDVRPEELILGGALVSSLSEDEKRILQGAGLHPGVRAACEAVCKKVTDDKRLS